ncbi:MAG: EAL domain-containing protein, partial [Inhella sp.]
GYSSLSYLRRLPISELKIDRCFVHNLVDSANDQALARALVAIAQAMKLRLVAEGVESEAQAQLLRELGCEAAQGYWLSPPLDAAAFATWVRARA